jgi:uncharacterized protein involved in exopolysaccharide biosynthesis
MTVTTPGLFDVPPAAAPISAPAPAGKRTDATFVQDVMAASWAYGWLVALVVVIAIALGVVWIIQSPVRYTSRLIVMPTEASQQLSDLLRNSGGSSLASSLGSLTGSEQVTYFDKFSKQLTSVGTAGSLKAHSGLIEGLMDLRWNDQKKIWESTSIATPIKAALGLDTTADTSAQAVAEFLRKNLGQEQDRDTPITTLSIDAQDAEVARQTLALIYQYSDDQIKKSTYEQTQSKLEYLQRRLQSVTVNDYRQTLIGLILDQEKILMLIQPNLPFAAQTLEQPEILSEPSSPKKGRTLIAAILIGLVVGSAIAYRLNRKRRA